MNKVLLDEQANRTNVQTGIKKQNIPMLLTKGVSITLGGTITMHSENFEMYLKTTACAGPIQPKSAQNERNNHRNYTGKYNDKNKQIVPQIIITE